MKAGRGGTDFDDEDEEDSDFFLFLGTGTSLWRASKNRRTELGAAEVWRVSKK